MSVSSLETLHKVSSAPVTLAGALIFLGKLFSEIQAERSGWTHLLASQKVSGLGVEGGQ